MQRSTPGAKHSCADPSWRAVTSHHSGKTEESITADLSVVLNIGQAKTGAPARSDRVARYNYLLQIKTELADTVEYAGWAALDP